MSPTLLIGVDIRWNDKKLLVKKRVFWRDINKENIPYE